MKIDACYILQKDPGCKTRFNEIQSTQNYELFEANRKEGNLWFYLSNRDYTNDLPRRKTEWKFIGRGSLGHITKVFEINHTNDPGIKWALGDIKNTQDLLIFRFKKNMSMIESFVCKGKKNDVPLFMSLIIDNDPDFNEEIRTMIDRAKGRD